MAALHMRCRRDAADEAQLADGVCWFALSDVTERQLQLTESGDVTRVLQSVIGASTLQQTHNMPLSVPLSTEQKPSTTPPPAHLYVSVLYTAGNRVLLTPSSHHRLPSTHCDKGETLTFTVHRFARALLGLPHTQPTVLALQHQSRGSRHSLHVVCHVAVDGAGASERSGSESGDELVESGSDSGSGSGNELRSYMRFRWYGEHEVSELCLASGMNAMTYACCQLAFSRMVAKRDQDTSRVWACRRCMFRRQMQISSIVYQSWRSSCFTHYGAQSLLFVVTSGMDMTTDSRACVHSFNRLYQLLTNICLHSTPAVLPDKTLNVHCRCSSSHSHQPTSNSETAQQQRAHCHR